MSWFRTNTTTEPTNLEDKFSIPYLRSLHQRLVENKVINAQNQSMVIETLRVLSEMVVFGDNNYELLFDFFCEKNMLALFLDIMHNAKEKSSAVFVPVLIQILQTMSILCQCVKNDTSLYYILSNNYINEFLKYPYDFENDELLDHFVSFLKSLSLRMNDQTIQFFFIEKTKTIPLLNRAIELLRFRDGMVRIAAQSSILNIFKVNVDQARAICLQDETLHSLFSQIVIILEAHYSSAIMCCLEYAAIITHPSVRDKGEGKAAKRIEDQLSDILSSLDDWIYYLQDLIGLNIIKLHFSLIQYLISNFIYPVLLDPLLRFIQDPRDEMQHSPELIVKSAKDSEEMLIFSINISFFFINKFLSIFTDMNIKKAIITSLFHPFSRKFRKTLISHFNSNNNDLSNTSEPYKEIENKNIYREAFIKILRTNFGSGLGNKLPMLGLLVLQSTSTISLPSNVSSSELYELIKFLGILPHRNLEFKISSDHLTEYEKEFELKTFDDPDVLIRSNLDKLYLYYSENFSDESILDSISSILIEPARSTLSTLQVASNCLYSFYMLERSVTGDIHLTPSSSSSSSSAIHNLEDIPDHDRLSLASSRQAVKVCAESISKRMQSSTGDIIISLFQEELRRCIGIKWTNVFQKMIKESLLLLPPVSNVTLRIGLEFGMPISQVEASRREVQSFLLVRSLFKQMYNLVTKSNPNFEIDDVSNKMSDDCIYKLSEYGYVNEVYREFSTILLTDRIIFPIVISNLASSSKNNQAQKPVNNDSSFWGSTFSSPSTSSSVTPVGVIKGQVSFVLDDEDDKWRENMYIVIDEYALLLVSSESFQNSCGIIRLVAPIHQTDVSISPEKKNILKILVRSTESLPLMERVGSASDNLMGSPEMTRNSSSVPPQGNRGIGLLQPRLPNALWRISLWFDNETDCETVSQHIELRRIQVRHEKIGIVKSMLESWADVSNLNPDICIL